MEPSQCNPARGIKLILAEDDPDDVMLFEEALGLSGLTKFALTVFANGKSLLDYLLSLKSPGDLPDVVIVDMNMPLCDGLGVLQGIRGAQHLGHLPVFMLSTTADPNQVGKSEKLGHTGYFVKPVKLQELKDIVVKIIGSVRA